MVETSIYMTSCDHFPGLRKMFYCFKDSILEMSEPRHVNQWRIPLLTLKDGKKLGRIYFLPGEANFNEPAGDSEHGDIYPLKATGQILSTDELLTSQLMSLSRKELVIFVEDEKGNLRVFGNTEKGARIKIGTTSSKISGNVFGYDFSIDYVSDEPAYWYDGAVEEDETGGSLLPDASQLDFEVNGTVEGQVSSALATGVDLVDGGGLPVVPVLITQVGNKFEIEVPAGAAPSGVQFLGFPKSPQRTQYRTGDLGTRTQAGWFDNPNPPNPKVVAALDHTSANFHYLMKDNLVVNGVSSKTRFVDVAGVQTFSAVGNKDLILLDKLTGYGIYRGNLTTTYSHNTGVDTALALSVTVDSIVYDDWYLISVGEYHNIFYGRGNHGAMIDPISAVNVFNMVSGTFVLADTWSSDTFYCRTWRDDGGNNIVGTQFKNSTGMYGIFVTKQTMGLITAP